MADGPGPAVQRRRLRVELRKARQDVGLTQEQVAEMMDWSLSKVIRIEAGSVGISTNDLKALLRTYNIQDVARADELLAIARNLPGWLVIAYPVCRDGGHHDKK